VGKVHTLRSKEIRVTRTLTESSRIPAEIASLQKALSVSIRELSHLKARTQEMVGVEEARIFDTHMMILQDSTMVDAVETMIRKEHVTARFAFHDVMSGQIEQFEKIEKEFAREKAMDLKDVYNRVLNIMLGASNNASALEVDEPSILTGRDLTPSQLIDLRKDVVLGFATDSGGRTSHVAILARSLRIPAVTGLQNVSILAGGAQQMIVDGSAGLVIVNPNENDLQKYAEKQEMFRKLEEELYTTRDLEPVTIDGKFIKLNANIELPVEADAVAEYGAGGVGLYRSEFLFFRKNLPSKREQCEAYRYILKKIYPKSVTIRTLDAGGDKLISELSAGDEANPFMGYRSIRVCLDRKEIFREQLQALLMASDSGNLRIMFPMISSVDEIRQAKEIFYELIEDFQREGWEHIQDMEIGVMIEVPSAVLMIEELAKEVDFFSIGTNDLIQFTLAVDRSNEKIASMFEPHHPAVLRMIKRVVDVAHIEGIDVSVCGEMTSDPLSALLLVGLGVDELSMNPWSIMECKKFIRSISYEEARNAAKEVLKYATTREINHYLEMEYLQKIMELGISSFVTKDYEFRDRDRTLVKVKNEIVGLSALKGN